MKKKVKMDKRITRARSTYLLDAGGKLIHEGDTLSYGDSAERVFDSMGVGHTLPQSKGIVAFKGGQFQVNGIKLQDIYRKARIVSNKRLNLARHEIHPKYYPIHWMVA